MKELKDKIDNLKIEATEIRNQLKNKKLSKYTKKKLKNRYQIISDILCDLK
jgi:hypothetical protein